MWKGVGFEPTYSLRDPGLQQTPLTLSILQVRRATGFEPCDNQLLDYNALAEPPL
jgi:hypothetical protein